VSWMRSWEQRAREVRMESWSALHSAPLCSLLGNKKDVFIHFSQLRAPKTFLISCCLWWVPSTFSEWWADLGWGRYEALP
jgi:hypothetical protein